MKSQIILSALLMGGPVIFAIESKIEVKTPWTIAVEVKDNGKTLSQNFTIDPSPVKTVEREVYKDIKVWNPKHAAWQQQALATVKSQECNTFNILKKDSLRLTDESGKTVYVRGKDYEADEARGTFGKLENSAVTFPAIASYQYQPRRLDSIVLTADGKLALIKGEPRINVPEMPAIAPGDRRIANIYLRGAVDGITANDIFPVNPPVYPVCSDVAEKLLPKTLAKLRNGEKIKIVAYGDSVTDGNYLPDQKSQRWQSQTVELLKKRFPKADIELVTVAKGGKNSSYFVDGDNLFARQLLTQKPDLVIQEFVNDSWISQPDFDKYYPYYLKEFKAGNTEWILLTPHYIYGMDERKDDPRPYVKMLKDFTAQNNIALADGSLRFHQIHQAGIPLDTLMLNSFNHPDQRGMKLFAESILALFPEQ